MLRYFCLRGGGRKSTVGLRRECRIADLVRDLAIVGAERKNGADVKKRREESRERREEVVTRDGRIAIADRKRSQDRNDWVRSSRQRQIPAEPGRQESSAGQGRCEGRARRGELRQERAASQWERA